MTAKSRTIDEILDLLTRPGATAYTRVELADRFGCSLRTITRYINELRDDRDLPIVVDRETGTYRVEGDAARQYLRGMYFEPAELDALLLVYQSLETLEGGLLSDRLAPLRTLIERRLSRYGDEMADISRRIRVIGIGGRHVPSDTFLDCARATLKRRRIHMRYDARGSGEGATNRIVSPQRLVRYRDNWYLDAYCHKRKAMRTFSLEQIQHMRILDEAAEEIDDKVLKSFFTAAYGIFSGEPVATAVIRFTPQRSRWVSTERWHPAQEGRFDDDGCWELSVPYASEKELVMDILRYGPDAQVLAPPELRAQIRSALTEALGLYD